ncbi:hypothetical protein ACWGPQ_09980 [Saccharomonospora azurea]
MRPVARRGVWLPLAVLALAVLGGVVETLLAPSVVVPTGPREDFGWFAYTPVSGPYSGQGFLPSTAYSTDGAGLQTLSAAEYSVLRSGSSDEYWWCAAAVCFLVLLAWYRGDRPWWRVVTVALVAPAVFALGIASMVVGATDDGIGVTVPGLLAGLAGMAGAWARWGQGRGRWLGVTACAALTVSIAVAALSDVLPTGTVVLLVAGATLAWFVRSPLAAVAAAVAGLVPAWSSDPVLPGVVAAVVLVLAAIASRHPRLRHV